MKKIYLHPLPVRIWHWMNAVSFLILIMTGLQIRYREALNITTFKTAVEIHNTVGLVLLFNFFIWLGFYLLSRKIGIYIPELSLKKFVENSFRQARYYAYGIFIGESNPHHGTPENKFNPLQQMAYLNIMMLLIPAQIATGILMLDVKGFAAPIGLVGGLKIVDSVHVLLFLFFSSFLFVHIYLATLGHTATAHIKAMFTGYEEVEDHH